MSATGINMSLDEATDIADEWVGRLLPFCKIDSDYCSLIEIAGTIRRKDQETTHDIDIVLIRDEAKQEEFAKIIDSLEYVKGKPDGKWCCRRLDSGVMLDIRMCTEEDWGWRLIQHTGPTDFYLWAKENIKSKQMGGFNCNFSTEEEVFKALGIDYVDPENRHKIEVDMSKIQNKDVSLFGVIGFEDATLDNIIKQTEDEDELKLLINSPGGDGEEGLAIFDYMVNLDIPVSVEIFGKAKSAAAIASQGADKGKRRMAKNASFMIHNPFMFTMGEADELEKQAEELKNFEERTVKLFAQTTGLSQKKIRELMEDGGTEMDAKKAKELGFIDEIIGAQDLAPIVWNMSDLPVEIAKQIPGSKAEKTPVFRWQDANANTNQLPEGSKLFDLRVNQQTYPMNKEKFLMLGQFVNVRGLKDPDAALADYTELAKNVDNNKLNQPAGILALESTVNTLQKDLDVSRSLLKGVVGNQAKQELEGRKDRVNVCLEEFRIDVKQSKKMIENYVDIEPDEAKDSQVGFDSAIEFMESSQPREDLKELTKLTGSGGEGLEGLSDEDKILAMVDAKQKKDPDMTFKVAYKAATDEFKNR